MKSTTKTIIIVTTMRLLVSVLEYPEPDNANIGGGGTAKCKGEPIAHKTVEKCT